MKPLWRQPSLSRYFTLLSVVIVLVIGCVSLWVVTVTYDEQSQKVIKQLESESIRIDRTLIVEIEHASFLLQALGRQIIRPDSIDYTRIAQLLKSFDTQATIYNVFSWIDENQQLAISSNKGILDKGIDVSDRDYMKRALADPWKVQIGRPIQGRVSEKWVIPISMGITNSTGKYVGTLLVSMDIGALSDKIQHVLQQQNISFAILSNTYTLLTEVSANTGIMFGDFYITERMQALAKRNIERGLITNNDVFHPNEHYIFYETSSKYPYIFLIGINGNDIRNNILVALTNRLVPLVLVGVALILFLWLVKLRILHPVMSLSKVSSRIATGETSVHIPSNGPAEIEILAEEIHRMSDYINERKRIEGELNSKLVGARKSREISEQNNKMKSEFISCLGQELRGPLNAIMGFSEVMKDQLYGPIENKKYVQYAADIHQSSKQFLHVINDILSLFKTDAGMLELQKKPIDVEVMLNKSLQMLEADIKEKGLRIQLTLQPNLPKLLVDEERFEQIILNLLANAAKTTPEGGEIVIEARLEHDEKDSTVFSIHVKDNSPGLDAEELDILMGRKPYPTGTKRQAKNDLKLSGGLGIPLTRMLAAMHQATLTIDSAPGRGTQVSVRFPKERIVFWN